MKKNLTFLILLALLVSSCASRRQNVFPREQVTGYGNQMLGRKYADVDTASFQKLERVERVFNLHIFFSGLVAQSQASIRRRQKIQEQRLQYPDIQINDIDHVFQWLRELFSDNRGLSNSTDPFFVDVTHYKKVEDGFLIKGVQTSHSIRALHHPCLRKEREMWKIFLVGFDHSLIWVRQWRERCPLAYEINIELVFPEFEEADVRFPELKNYSFDSLLVANMRYPVSASEIGLQGVVVASFTVEADGEVSDVRIVRGTDSVFEREVRRTVQSQISDSNRQWISGTKNGEKIPMEIIVRVWFLFDPYTIPRRQPLTSITTRVTPNRRIFWQRITGIFR